MCNCKKKTEGGGGGGFRANITGRLMTPALTPALTPAFAPAFAPALTQASTDLDTVDTSIWGPPLWKALHVAAQFSAARNHAGNWNTIMNALKTDLPCPDCSSHYNAWIKNNVLRTTVLPNGIQSAITTWLLRLHNTVNIRNGCGAWTVDQMKAEYGGGKAGKVAEAITALETVRDIIGRSLFSALMTLLRSL